MTTDLAHFRRQITESLLKLQRSNDVSGAVVSTATPTSCPTSTTADSRHNSTLASPSPSKLYAGEASSSDDGRPSSEATVTSEESKCRSDSENEQRRDSGVRMTSSPPSLHRSRDSSKRIRRGNFRSRRVNHDVIRSSPTPESDAAAAAAAMQSRFTSFFVADILGMSSTSQAALTLSSDKCSSSFVKNNCRYPHDDDHGDDDDEADDDDDYRHDNGK